MSEKDFEASLEDLAAGSSAAAEDAPQSEKSDPSSHPSVAALVEKFGSAIQHHTIMSGDEHVVYVSADRAFEILSWLKEDPSQRYDFLQDLTAVDWGGNRPLEVVYQLWSNPHKRQLRVKVTLALSALETYSVWPIWRAANWLEREVWDMFGIRFRGHPDLRRILMPDSYAEGHPLRKDFPLRGRFTRAEQTKRALAMGVTEHYSAEELAVVGEAKPHAQPPRQEGGQ